jgi:hypothetical protein
MSPHGISSTRFWKADARKNVETIMLARRASLLSPTSCARLSPSGYSPSLPSRRFASFIVDKATSPTWAAVRLVHHDRAPLLLTTRTNSSSSSSSSYKTSKHTTVHIRHATTRLASQTAINPPSTVPPQNHALYASLEQVKHLASDHVNQSRVQHARRGLESSRPTVRIGLLGLGQEGNVAARKLARLLLADVLEDEGDWERVLTQASSSHGKPLLLRYVLLMTSPKHVLTNSVFPADMVLKMTFSLSIHWLIKFAFPHACWRRIVSRSSSPR